MIIKVVWLLPVEEKEDGEGSLKTDARHICPRHTSSLISAMSSFHYDDDDDVLICSITLFSQTSNCKGPIFPFRSNKLRPVECQGELDRTKAVGPACLHGCFAVTS